VRVVRPAYPLMTERLMLRPFTDDDLDALHDLHGRPEVTRFLYWDPISRDDARRMLKRRMKSTQIEKEGDAIQLAMVLPESGSVIGHVNLQLVSRTHRLGEIGFVLHPDHAGRGYASEASLVLLRLGFEELGLHRIIGRCDARNNASARLMERLGMRREAHLRENEFIKGEWTDELIYAMLASEWQAPASR
jgi:RimJ/RimL family protein N-acetyltransferase